MIGIMGYVLELHAWRASSGQGKFRMIGIMRYVLELHAWRASSGQDFIG